MTAADRAARLASGDWQTPPTLAREVARLLAAEGVAPAAVLDPTCGSGALLAAAAEAFPGAALVGCDVSPGHVEAARRSLAGLGADLAAADVFDVDWPAALARLPRPVLVFANPPWVTTSRLGALGSRNRPARAGLAPPRGIDGLTGAAGFDVSGAVVEALVRPLLGSRFAVAALLKASTARWLLALADAGRWPVRGRAWSFDARAHFGASVGAALVLVEGVEAAPGGDWPWADALGAPAARSAGVVGGVVARDAEAARRTARLSEGPPDAWRSGVKHDCAAALELRRVGGRLVDRAGGPVDVEPELVYPLLKGADVARGRPPSRFLLLPQRGPRDDTARLEAAAPAAWAYLAARRRLFEARRSAVYRRAPPFAVFGVGPYSFAPYKVAVCGLSRGARFAVVGPFEGRPGLLDDTSYALAFEDEAGARDAAALLNGPAAREFLLARVCPDAKRPVTARLLSSLSLAALRRAAG